MRLVSECCYAPPIEGTEDEPTPNVYTGRCSKCKENTMLIEDDDGE